MNTKNLELTEVQAIALDAALTTETKRLDDIIDAIHGHAINDEADKLLASCARCRESNEYLRGRIAGLLEQF